jgi:hypothetical protein
MKKQIIIEILMICLTKCKQKLNRNGVHYTDKQIEVIREILYILAKECQKNN